MIIKKVADYIQNNGKSNMWSAGNDVLYKMCADYIKHDKQDMITAKLWLIGRSYAAAIERRKKYGGIETEKFFADIVIPDLYKKHKEFDEKIEKLLKYDCPDEYNIHFILELHKYLTDKFKKYTGLEKRSLASKYLHFHCPNLFFIYDSRACKSIKSYVQKIRTVKYNDTYDIEYQDFFYRAMKLKKFIEEFSQSKITPRDIDNLLIFEE